MSAGYSYMCWAPCCCWVECNSSQNTNTKTELWTCLLVYLVNGTDEDKYKVQSKEYLVIVVKFGFMTVSSTVRKLTVSKVFSSILLSFVTNTIPFRAFLNFTIFVTGFLSALLRFLFYRMNCSQPVKKKTSLNFPVLSLLKTKTV